MGKFIDITGQQFGNWKAIEYDKENKKWLCECQCENRTRKLIASADLRKGKTTNCGCQRKKDLTGRQFKYLIVDSYAGDYHWNCHCIECGKQFKVHTYHLEHDNIPNCTHSDLHTNVDDITGQQFGDWKVLSYAGNKYWNCECQCELHTKRKVLGRDLRSGRSKSCGLDKPQVRALMESDSTFVDLTGKHFGEWEVIEYVGNKRWKCKCSCGNILNVLGTSLKSGNSKSCGHDSGKLKDITGQQFGELTALEYIGKGDWRCKCSCGEEVVVSGHSLRSGHTKSCGSSIHRYKNISGQRFGMLVAEQYIGNCKWLCKCDCGNTIEVYGANLRSGGTQSCGCSSTENRIKTMIDNGRYNYRTSEQIHALMSEDNLRSFIGNKPLTMYELSKKLGVSYSYIIGYIRKKYNIDDLLKLDRHSSRFEDELYEYINTIYKGSVQRHNRSMLNGNELDIYIPNEHIAIEFNGTYWHCSDLKNRNYHQQKTLDCAKQGIQLIHIFEYEWINNDSRRKLERYLQMILSNNKDIKYARNMNIRQITNSDEYKRFENEHHFQFATTSSINIGLYDGDKLIGLMTFGKPRFNHEYEYELIRLCYDNTVNVVGGTEKMFKYFLRNYNPQSIITYCDISKFTGNSYLRLGFKPIQPNPITDPNYVWISPDRNEVLQRYQTQKQRLLKAGLGTEDQTEDEIMKALNYLKVYDAGNLRLEWRQE